MKLRSVSLNRASSNLKFISAALAVATFASCIAQLTACSSKGSVPVQESAPSQKKTQDAAVKRVYEKNPGLERDLKRARETAERETALANDPDLQSVYGKNGHPKPMPAAESASSGDYMPTADGDVPASTGMHLISPDGDCDMSHAALAFGAASGPFTLHGIGNPVRLENERIGKLSPKNHCGVLVMPEFFQGGDRRLPMLIRMAKPERGFEGPTHSGARAEILLPVKLCIGDARASQCTSDVPADFKLEDEDRLVSRLKGDSAAFGKIPGAGYLMVEYAPVDYERVFAGQANQPALPELTVGVDEIAGRSNNLPVVDARIHPGANRALQAFSTQALNQYRAAGIKNGSLGDFIQRVQVADCDMMAQALSFKDPSRHTIVAYGNRPTAGRAIDARVSNHAWNLRETSFGVHLAFDRTPFTHPLLEHYFTQAMADASLAQLPGAEFKFSKLWTKIAEPNWLPMRAQKRWERDSGQDRSDVLQKLMLANTPYGDLNGRGDVVSNLEMVPPPGNGGHLGANNVWMIGKKDMLYIWSDNVTMYSLGDNAAERTYKKIAWADSHLEDIAMPSGRDGFVGCLMNSGFIKSRCNGNDDGSMGMLKLTIQGRTEQVRYPIRGFESIYSGPESDPVKIEMECRDTDWQNIHPDFKEEITVGKLSELCKKAGHPVESKKLFTGTGFVVTD